MYLVRPSYFLKKIYPSAVWRMNTSQKKIYLTFDDGPVPDVTPWVLDLLKEHSIRGTFFCVGENIQKHPEIYKRILEEKHSTGNHTFNHLNGWNTDTNEYIGNIEKCAELMDTNLFRPPYGKLKPSQMKHINKRYEPIMWDVLSGDFDKATGPEKCLENVVGASRNGSIIVFHDSLKAAKNLYFALPRFIDYTKQQGFEFGVL